MCNQEPRLVKPPCKAITPSAIVSVLCLIILCLYPWCSLVDHPIPLHPNTHSSSSFVHLSCESRLMRRYCPYSSDIDFQATIPTDSYCFSPCITWSSGVHLPALPVSAFTHAVSLTQGTVHPHTSKSHLSSVGNFQACPVPWSVFWLSPFFPSLPTPSLTVDLYIWGTLITSSLPLLRHSSCIYLLPVFYYLHCTFL